MPTVTPAQALRRMADLLDDHPDVNLHDVVVFIDHLPLAEQHQIAEALRSSGPSMPHPLPHDKAVLHVRPGGFANGPLKVFAAPVVVFAEPARDHTPFVRTIDTNGEYPVGPPLSFAEAVAA